MIWGRLSDKPNSLDKETQFIKFMINFAKDYYDKNTDEILIYLGNKK